MEESLIPTYSVSMFSEYLAKHFDQEVASAFERNKVSGSAFMKLSESQIGKMVEAIGDIVELQSLQCRVYEAGVEVLFTMYLFLCVNLFWVSSMDAVCFLKLLLSL